MATSDNASEGSAETLCSLADVVEDLGLGQAQLRTVLLAGAVPLGMGSHLAMLSLVTASVAAEFNLGESQQSFLTMLVYAGMLVGGLAGGRLGDSAGRRFAIILSTFMLAVFGFFAAVSPRWPILLLCYVVLGLAMGLGFPAACALVSEVSPKAWRTATRAACDALFDLGFMYSAMLASLQDPVLYDLHWRNLIAWASVPCVVLGPLSLMLLEESPLFLAAGGMRAAAREAVLALGRANGAAPSGLRFELPSKSQVGATSFAAVCKRHFHATAALSYVAFVLTLLYCSGTYLLSQVQTQGSHDLVGGWQMVGSGGLDILALIASAWFARYMPRPLALEVALISGAITVWSYASCNGITNRNLVTEMVRQFGVLGFYWVPALGFIALYQTAVEAYPTTSAATGTGVVLAAGRLGAILTPDLLSRFQAVTGNLNLFCYFVGSACALGAVAVHVLLLRHGPASLEASPLLGNPEQRKAAAAEA